MEHIISCSIENIGEFEYYLTKTKIEGITTYGIADKDVNDCRIESVCDMWTEKEPVLQFLNLLADSQVTCIHLRELCEEFVEQLYSI